MTTKTKKSEPVAYKNHKPGSRKGEVHKVLDEKGRAAALEHGLKLGLKQGTLTSWFGSWARAENKKGTPSKPGAKDDKSDKGSKADTGSKSDTKASTDKAVKALRAKAAEMKAKVVKVGTGERQIVKRAA